MPNRKKGINDKLEERIFVNFLLFSLYKEKIF